MTNTDDDRDTDTAAKFLLASFGVVTATLTALGAVTGTIDRVERNEKNWFTLGIALAVCAVAIGAIGLLAGTRQRVSADWPWPLRGRSIRVAVLLAGITVWVVGMVLVTIAVVRTPSAQPRPSITATLKAGSTVTLISTIEASGLAANQDVHVEVDGVMPTLRAADGKLIDQKGRPSKTKEWHRLNLYASDFGPNASGEVKTKIEVPVPPGGMFQWIQMRAWINREPGKCDVGREATGCLTIRLPSTARGRPRLIVRWEGSSDARVLAVKVAGGDLPTSVYIPSETDHLFRPARLAIAITARPFSPTRARSLFRSLLAPDSSGTVDAEFKIPIGTFGGKICIAVRPEAVPASAVAPPAPVHPRCAVPGGQSQRDTVWTLVRVPL